MSYSNDKEPLAYCQQCRDWKPMRWLPKNERKKHFESWFECAHCGCRQLTFRYIYQKRPQSPRVAASPEVE